MGRSPSGHLGSRIGAALLAEDYPRIEGEVVFEVQNDWTYSSDDAGSEINDLFTATEPDINVFATEELFLNLRLTLEPAVDPKPDDDRVFEDHGLFVETQILGLFVTYTPEL